MLDTQTNVPGSVAKGIEGRLLSRILTFFQESHDFNGIRINSLGEEFGLTSSQLGRHLRALLKKGKVSLAFGNHSGNPHIKRVADLPVEEQIVRLDRFLLDRDHEICAYPSQAVLIESLDLAAHAGTPYTRRLALGEPQMTAVFFEFEVLERYYRDPRFRYDFDDREGSISIRDEHDQSETTRERDKILLESFGIGYDPNRRRVVGVYLRYLAALSPEHQRYWETHAVTEPCVMNSDYERASVWGLWPEFRSAYKAFLTEQTQINRLCSRIGKPPLFRSEFEENRPSGFAPLLRPTARSFHDFVHLLDKMLSENLNKDFFRGDLQLEEEIARKDGTVEVRQKGTVALLREWFDTRYTDARGNLVGDELVAPLREVRTLRQGPAHALQDDVYDFAYVERQNELMKRVIPTLTKIRLVLSSHPDARGRYAAPSWLDGDKIVFY